MKRRRWLLALVFGPLTAWGVYCQAWPLISAASSSIFQGNRQRRSDLAMMWSRGRGQGRGPVTLTVAPMRLEDVAHFIPMGMVVGAHVTPIDHAYFEPRDRTAGRFAYDVFAPADGYVVNIQHRVRFEGSSETQRDYDDWRLVIEHTGTFYTYYDLITRVEPAVVDAMTVDDSRGLQYSGRVPVKAGQRIGKIGGHTLDFAVVDTESRLKGLLVSEHYDREPWKIHTVDPIAAFAEPVRNAILERNPRRAEPRGGKIDYDVDGRLVGNWFREGTNGYAGAGDPRGYWMGHLSFCYHHIDPTKLMVSIGDYDGRSRQFMVRGNRPDPATVSQSTGPVKYELILPTLGSDGRVSDTNAQRSFGVILVQVIADRRLRIQIFPDRVPDEVQQFSDAFQYER